GPDPLATGRLRHADDRYLGDGGNPGDAVLDLVREDVEAGHVDHVLLAVDDAEIAALVHGRDVAGVEPAAAQRLVGLVGAVQVALEHLAPAGHQLTGLARRGRVVVRGDDADLGARIRDADRADAVLAHGGIDAQHRAGFRQAVALDDLGTDDLLPFLGGGRMQ